jgi:hypothetical protein
MSNVHDLSEIVSQLQTVQLETDMFSEPASRLHDIRKGVAKSGIDAMLGMEIELASNRIFARPPQTTNEFGILPNIAFSGRLHEVGYLADDDVPIDELTLNFIEADVQGVDSRDAVLLKEFVIQVPILSLVTRSVRLLG